METQGSIKGRNATKFIFFPWYLSLINLLQTQVQGVIEHTSYVHNVHYHLAALLGLYNVLSSVRGKEQTRETLHAGHASFSVKKMPTGVCRFIN